MLRDPTAFQFSNAQREIFNGWVRPKDESLLDNHRPSSEWFREPEPSLVTHNKIDLVQDMTSDCSIVASLCAIIARVEKGYDGVSKCALSSAQATLKEDISCSPHSCTHSTRLA